MDGGKSLTDTIAARNGGDPRLGALRAAAVAMTRGQFRVEVPLHGDDEVAQLGVALRDLGQILEQRFQEMQMLSGVTGQINAGLLLDEVLNSVYESFRPLIPYDRIGFSLLDDDGHRARSYWARAEYHPLYLSRGYSAPLSSSSLRFVLESRCPRILNDLDGYLANHPDSESTALMVREGIRSSLTCPLVAMGKAIGFMFFSSRRAGTYEEAHVELFSEIAGQLALIVEKGRLYQRLVELNRVKDQFLGMAAHDLRSPISSIVGYLQVYREGLLGESAEARARVLDTVDRTCHSMLALIDDLLTVTAIESGRLELQPVRVPAAALLKEWLERAAILARRKSIAVEAEKDAELPAVVLDPRRMQQVVDNLVSNAIKFSHPDTRITIGARVEGTQFVVWVRDQGLGIPEKDMPRLFSSTQRPGVRPTAGESSTGFGLAIVKRIVEAHGGRIEVESKVGVGSTFRVLLPLPTP